MTEVNSDPNIPSKRTIQLEELFWYLGHEQGTLDGLDEERSSVSASIVLDDSLSIDVSSC